MRQYFLRVAKLNVEIERLGGTYIRNPTSIDPFEGFSISLPCETSSDPNQRIYLRGCSYTPYWGTLGSNSLRVSGFEFEAGEVLQVAGDDSYVPFNVRNSVTLEEVETFLAETQALIEASGGIVKSSGSAGRGIEFIGVGSSISNQVFQLKFVATLGLGSGAGGGLIDDVTGAVVRDGNNDPLNLDALDIVVGDSTHPARMNMLSRHGAYVDYSAGEVSWNYHNEDGSVGTETTSVPSLGGAVAVLRQSLADQRILVHVGDGGELDPGNLAIRFTAGEQGGFARVEFKRFITPPGAGVGVQVAVLFGIRVDGSGLVFWKDFYAVGVDSAGNPVVDKCGIEFDGGLYLPLFAPFAAMMRAMDIAPLVRRIESFAPDMSYRINTDGGESYLQFRITFNIGGVEVQRAVRFVIVEDAETSSWRVGRVEWAVYPDDGGLPGTATWHRIDWPGIYYGFLPGKMLPTEYNRRYSHADTLVGQFLVDGGTTQTLQFTGAAFDATKPDGTPLDSLIVMPRGGKPGIYGWLEAVGPTINGVNTRIPITDPRHPYTLASNLRAGTITRAQYEEGMLRVLIWFLEFASSPTITTNPGLYSPTNTGGVVPVSSNNPADPCNTNPNYPDTDPSWAHLLG